MKTTEELQNLYETKLKPALESIEGQRKSILYKYIICIVGALGSFAAAFLLAETYIIVFYLAIAAILGLGFYMFFVVGKQKKAYRIIYKQDVVKAIVELINPDWRYESEGRISETDYRKSQLFNTTCDKYEGDDLVTGVIEKTDFQFSELHTQYKTYTTKDGKTEEEWHTIFKGLFAHADFNKEIKGRTFVLPEHAKKDFTKYNLSEKDGGETKLVKLENPVFEKIFKVFGTDQIESRYVLTPTMMEAMVNIYNKYKKRVHFSFIGSRVFVAMSFNKDLFEPRIIKSGVRFEDMEQMNEQFNLIQTLIHEMNLNTRIWTKD
ncbi:MULTISPECIES: DUF3137 domain-containing protein [unclassified Lentimicrobium]|uniref:DUF3137 domain-containing protein n=1 Tax=unclassified Lentimicrobium TaxID=2677434 RepID=UPI001555760E|nr:MULTISPECIES: DUF3137 domain-containing protein [unclassified Lentimicrobium]NPD44636.1 DUF3137 domain-containing protein [Lentimicrobium sp. S6]NPD83348.1 DUF3137 domain-containing protein [Lentimicrobium sp. L6]